MSKPSERNKRKYKKGLKFYSKKPALKLPFYVDDRPLSFNPVAISMDKDKRWLLTKNFDRPIVWRHTNRHGRSAVFSDYSFKNKIPLDDKLIHHRDVTSHNTNAIKGLASELVVVSKVELIDRRSGRINGAYRHNGGLYKAKDRAVNPARKNRKRDIAQLMRDADLARFDFSDYDDEYDPFNLEMLEHM